MCWLLLKMILGQCAVTKCAPGFEFMKAAKH